MKGEISVTSITSFLALALLLMQRTCSNTDPIMIFSSTVLYFGDIYIYIYIYIYGRVSDPFPVTSPPGVTLPPNTIMKASMYI